MYNSLAILSIYDTISLLLTEANPISKGGKKCQINLKKADMLARNLLLKICAKLIEFLNKILLDRGVRELNLIHGYAASLGHP